MLFPPYPLLPVMLPKDKLPWIHGLDCNCHICSQRQDMPVEVFNIKPEQSDSPKSKQANGDVELFGSSDLQHLLSLEIASDEDKVETLGKIIDGIDFPKKPKTSKSKKKKQFSETSSRSSLSSYEIDSKSVKSEQSKSWNQKQQELFIQLLDKFGTDFNMIKQHFPKKSKNQIKTKYKQMTNEKKKYNKIKKQHVHIPNALNNKKQVNENAQMKQVSELKDEESQSQWNK